MWPHCHVHKQQPTLHPGILRALVTTFLYSEEDSCWAMASFRLRMVSMSVWSINCHIFSTLRDLEWKRESFNHGCRANIWQSLHVCLLTWVQPGTPWRHCNCPCSNSTWQHGPDRRIPLSSLPWTPLSESARLPMSSPVDKDIYK